MRNHELGPRDSEPEKTQSVAGDASDLADAGSNVLPDVRFTFCIVRAFEPDPELRGAPDFVFPLDLL